MTDMTPEDPVDATPAETPPATPTAPVAPTAADAPSAASDEDATPPESAAPATSAAASMSPAECARQLREHFPALFDGPPKPLKLRIQADIQARAPGVFSRKALSGFLHRHTTTTAYLLALTRNGQRHDLDGQVVEAVQEEHRAAAQTELQRRRERSQSRRAEEDEARRWRADLLRDHARTTLTPANFCALKGIAPEALDGLLAQARAEAEAPPPSRPQDPRRADRPRGPGPHRGPRGSDGRGPERGERVRATEGKPRRP